MVTIIASKILKKKFSKKFIKEYYFMKIKQNTMPGLDKIDENKFEKRLNFYIDLIYKKVWDETYHFTPYKEKLLVISKNKIRQISIPTIQDKLALGVLKEVLLEVYLDIHCQLVQSIINDIGIKLKMYDSFVKIDIHGFYSSINHDLLMKILYKKIRKNTIRSLIKKAISNPIMSNNMLKEEVKMNLLGIPQGISISNILSSVYLEAVDAKYLGRKDICYFRYVDDILILCAQDQIDTIKKEITFELKDKYKLECNKDKQKDGMLEDGFEYLGYKIDTNVIKVRQSSLHIFEKKIQNMFDKYKIKGYFKKNSNNLELFVWDLNLKITGCINDKRKYGWLFFFSQITDEEVLFHLDWLVNKYIKRYHIKLNANVKIKRFTRTYNEIRKNLHNTTYIPNFDKYEEKQIDYFLIQIYKQSIEGWNIEQKKILFKKIVYRKSRDLEKDIQFFS